MRLNEVALTAAAAVRRTSLARGEGWARLSLADSLKALGPGSIDNEFVVIVREGKSQTHTATMTAESLAALMAAMSPESLPETGGILCPSYAVLAILGGLMGISGFGLEALRWRRRSGG